MAHRRHRLRRLILDEAGQVELTEAPKPSATSSNPRVIEHQETRTYAAGATRRHQMKTTDFIPKRLAAYAVVVFLLFVSVGILNWFATMAGKWANVISAEASNAFSLSGMGSFSGWFSSFLLILTGLASLQIYALRQHRNDDYRGTYRLWLWMACLFVIASMNCIVDFGAVASAVSRILSKDLATGVSSLWWLVAIKIVALTALVVRGLLEVRASRSATVMVVIVWIAYTALIVIQIPQAKNLTVMNYETVYGNSHLVGTVFVLLAVLTYARLVFLQANGLIQTATKEQKTVEKKKAVTTTSTAKKSKPLGKQTVIETAAVVKKNPPAYKTPAGSRKKPSAAPSKRSGLTSPLAAKMASMNATTDEISEDLNQEEVAEILQLRDKKVLNKAERRRLKKLQKRQHQRRAA